jgi:hypothetical protein
VRDFHKCWAAKNDASLLYSSEISSVFRECYRLLLLLLLLLLPLLAAAVAAVSVCA